MCLTVIDDVTMTSYDGGWPLKEDIPSENWPTDALNGPKTGPRYSFSQAVPYPFLGPNRRGSGLVDPFLTRNCMRVVSTRSTYGTTGPVAIHHVVPLACCLPSPPRTALPLARHMFCERGGVPLKVLHEAFVLPQCLLAQHCPITTPWSQSTTWCLFSLADWVGAQVLYH